MTYPPEFLKVVKRVVWFDPPEETLKHPRIFLAHLMTFGTEADIRLAKKYFSDDAFRDALEHSPPGVFTRSSWARWNEFYGRTPVPPLPKRFLDSPDWEAMLWGDRE